jgi:hypothetical protein
VVLTVRQESQVTDDHECDREADDRVASCEAERDDRRAHDDAE